MRGHALALAIAVFLSACAEHEAAPPPAAPLAIFKGGDVLRVDDAACKGGAQDRAASALCAYGWRPMADAAVSAEAVDTYQLFWARTDLPLVTVRVSRFADGTGAIWVTRYEKATRESKDGTQVNLISAAELAPLAKEIAASRFWTAGQTAARAADAEATCTERARWILEGAKKDARKAVSTANCDAEGRWVVTLGTDMLSLAQQKIPGLKLEPIY
jgi:hypothetical protein